MAMRAMTRELTEVDSRIRGRRRRLLAENDPDEAGTLREDIDDLLEARHAITTARGTLRR